MTRTIQFIANTVDSLIRNDEMEGKPYLVVPVVMMVEGVHNGSNGPLYYPADELAKLPLVWNHKPVVIYHPETGTACSPQVLTDRKVGVIMNTVFADGKLKAEAWLEETRMEEVDQRVLDALNTNSILEVSTGVFTENEEVAGEWNGEAYTAIARNHKPDHLAILPDQQGACSIEDGAGLNRNKAKDKKTSLFARFIHNFLKIDRTEVADTSFREIEQQLREILKERISGTENYYPWIIDVFDTFFIYEVDDELFKITYMKDEKGIVTEIGSIPTPVEKVTMYQTKQENVIDTVVVKNKGENNMDKKTKVAGIIKNTEFTDSDEAMLLALDDVTLDRMTAVFSANTEGEGEGEGEGAGEGAGEGEGEEEAPVANMEDFLKTVPAELKESLLQMLSGSQKEKSDLITTITANEKNILTNDQLMGMSVSVLKGIVAVHNTTAVAAAAQYAGQGVAAPTPTGNGEQDAEALTMPVMNFDSAE